MYAVSGIKDYIELMSLISSWHGVAMVHYVSINLYIQAYKSRKLCNILSTRVYTAQYYQRIKHMVIIRLCRIQIVYLFTMASSELIVCTVAFALVLVTNLPYSCPGCIGKSSVYTASPVTCI